MSPTIIMVISKFISLCLNFLSTSRRASELQSSDLLLITLLAHSFFPSTDGLEELMSPKKPDQAKPHKRMDSNHTQASNSGEEYYHSAGEEGSEAVRGSFSLFSK